MSVFKKFGKDVGIVGITNLIVALRSLILISIISKTLGSYGLGIWAQVGITLGLIDPIAGLTLSYTFVRFFSGVTDKELIREGFFSMLSIILCWSFFISSILFVFSNQISSVLFGGVDAVDIVRITAIIVPFSTINPLLLFFFRTYGQIKMYSSLTILQNIIEVAVIAYLVLSGFGIFEVILSILIIKFIMDLIVLAIIVTQIGIKIPQFTNLELYLRFSIPLIPSQLSSWIISSSDRYAIGLFMDITFIGVYSAAYGIGNVISMFITPITFVLVPAISKSYDDKNIDDVSALLKYSLKYLLMISIPSAFGLSILAKPLLQIMTKSDFVSSGFQVVPFVAFSMVLFSIYGIVGQVIVLVKKTKITSSIWGISGLINIFLNILLIPKIGILAAAITTLIAYAIATAIALYYSNKYLKLRIDLTFVFKSIVASIIMSMIIWYANPIKLLDILFLIGIGACVYVLILFMLKGFTKEEFKFFRDLIKV